MEEVNLKLTWHLELKGKTCKVIYPYPVDAETVKREQEQKFCCAVEVR